MPARHIQVLARKAGWMLDAGCWILDKGYWMLDVAMNGHGCHCDDESLPGGHTVLE